MPKYKYIVGSGILAILAMSGFFVWQKSNSTTVLQNPGADASSPSTKTVPDFIATTSDNRAADLLQSKAGADLEKILSDIQQTKCASVGIMFSVQGLTSIINAADVNNIQVETARAAQIQPTRDAIIADHNLSTSNPCPVQDPNHKTRSLFWYYSFNALFYTAVNLGELQALALDSRITSITPLSYGMSGEK